MDQYVREGTRGRPQDPEDSSSAYKVCHDPEVVDDGRSGRRTPGVTYDRAEGGARSDRRETQMGSCSNREVCGTPTSVLHLSVCSDPVYKTFY